MTLDARNISFTVQYSPKWKERKKYIYNFGWRNEDNLGISVKVRYKGHINYRYCLVGGYYISKGHTISKFRAKVTKVTKPENNISNQSQPWMRKASGRRMLWEGQLFPDRWKRSYNRTDEPEHAWPHTCACRGMSTKVHPQRHAQRCTSTGTSTKICLSRHVHTSSFAEASQMHHYIYDNTVVPARTCPRGWTHRSMFMLVHLQKSPYTRTPTHAYRGLATQACLKGYAHTGKSYEQNETNSLWTKETKNILMGPQGLFN